MQYAKKDYLALKTLYFGNTQPYIIRGKLYTKFEYEFAQTIASHSIYSLEFVNFQGKMIKLSNNPEDKYYYEKLFRYVGKDDE